LNAWAGFSFILLLPGFDTALGGSIFSLTGWIVMAAVIGVLVWSKQLPVKMAEEVPPPPISTTTE
jgi:uncharacterized membrane protein